MAKSKRKKATGTLPVKQAKKIEKTTKRQAQAAEYISYLLKLHKLEWVLLHRLEKQVQ